MPWHVAKDSVVDYAGKIVREKTGVISGDFIVKVVQVKMVF